MYVYKVLQASVGLLYLGHLLLGLSANGRSDVNLALNKNAIQSSTYTEIGGQASRAVDGVYDGDYSHNSCTHTRNDSPAWWAVDLGQETTVHEVVIKNRDEFGERLSNFYIGLTNVDPWFKSKAPDPEAATSSICMFVENSSSFTEYGCRHDVKPGRYLFIVLKNQNFLSLCEVAAYSTTEDTEDNFR